MIFCLRFSLGLEPQVYKSGRVETLDPGHGGEAKPAFFFCARIQQHEVRKFWIIFVWSYPGNNNMIHENTEFAPSCAASLAKAQRDHWVDFRGLSRLWVQVRHCLAWWQANQRRAVQSLGMRPRFVFKLQACRPLKWMPEYLYRCYQMFGAFVTTFLKPYCVARERGPAMLHLVPLICRPWPCCSNVPLFMPYFKLARQWMCSLGSPGKCTLTMCQLPWRISWSVWWLVLLKESFPKILELCPLPKSLVVEIFCQIAPQQRQDAFYYGCLCGMVVVPRRDWQVPLAGWGKWVSFCVHAWSSS